MRDRATLAFVLTARDDAAQSYKHLTGALTVAVGEGIPPHASRQLIDLCTRALQLWEDLDRMLAGGALTAPTPPSEQKE